MRSLKAQNHPLANSTIEIDLLESIHDADLFQDKLAENGLFPLKPTHIQTLQINLGKMCNQVCKHCHVDAGPDRTEIMNKQTMMECLKVIKDHQIQSVDLTGGAPEMNPDFRWLVREIRRINSEIQIIVRCNLTIIVSNPKYYDLPTFFKENSVEVASSLPFFNALKTDSQRGEGVFDKSIKALKMLNAVGYGLLDSGLILNLVYNPTGAFLPASQEDLETEFKRKLKTLHGIEFNRLFAITNLPISRFLEYLTRSGNYETYMEKLIEAFNPSAAENVMCRNIVSVGWDGYLYDCDFNQMLELKVSVIGGQHISDWNQMELLNREIIVKQHCYGCTAGAGSSCGGATSN